MALISAVRTKLNAVVPGLPLGDILLGNIWGFKRGFVFEVIDTATKKALMTKALVLNPRVYTLTEPFASTLTPTEDNTVVAEENGVIIREIVLEGTTGLKQKAEDALGRGGSIGTEASGVDHFYQLRDVFREYSILKQDPARSPFIQMVFHDVKADDHFIVVPRAFETPRDASTSRMHLNYRITLAAIQQLPPPRPPGEDPLLGELGSLGDTIKTITQAMHVSRSLLVEAIDLVELYRERIRDPELFFESAALSINAVHDFVDGVTVNIALGQEFHAASKDLVEDVEEQLENDIDEPPDVQTRREGRRMRRLRKSMTESHQFRETFEPSLGDQQARFFAADRNLTDTDLAGNLAGAEQGTRTRLARGGGNGDGYDLGSFSGSNSETVEAGDTVDSIAARANVPRDAIVTLNNLKYPYITAGGGPGTLKPGDTILVPVRSSGTRIGAQPTDLYLTPDDILYGTDMALDELLAQEGVFDIAVDELHGGQDTQIVRGKNNVVQGVQITIGTEKGTTTFLSDLGMRPLVGTKGTVANMLLASLYLREAILSDSRIRGIDSTRIVLEGDVLTQEITPQLIGSRDGVTVTVPFGKASQ
jgi:hypothetical protein